MYTENEDYDQMEENVSNNAFSNFFNNNKKLVIIVIAVIVLLLFLSLTKSCGNSGNGGNNGNNISIVLSSEEENISVGYSIRLSADIRGDSNPNVEWISSNPNIATVDSLGNVTGVSLGEAIVTIKYIDENNKEYTKSCKIIVSEGNKDITATNVAFIEGEVMMSVNSQFKLLKKIEPENAYIDKLVFTSSDTTVATVDDTGLVKSLKVGKATISMNVNNGMFKDDIVVNVVADSIVPYVAQPPTFIGFDSNKYNVKIGDKVSLTLKKDPVDSYLKISKWTSSDTNIAFVDASGVVTGVSEGTVTITAETINGLTATTTVEVVRNEIKVTGITVANDNITINVNQTSQIVPIVNPGDATNKKVSYTSSNPSVVTVDGNGVIWGLSSGSAVIYITTNDGGFKKEVRVTVIGGSSGGSSGGDIGGNIGGETGGSCSSNIIQLESTSSAVSDTKTGALTTTKGGNNATVTKGFEISTSKIPTSASCGSLNSLSYCLVSNQDTVCSTFKTINVGDKINVSISGQGVGKLVIKAEYSSGIYEKTYYYKYKASGSTGTTTCDESLLKLKSNYSSIGAAGEFLSTVAGGNSNYATKSFSIDTSSIPSTTNGCGQLISLKYCLTFDQNASCNNLINIERGKSISVPITGSSSGVGKIYVSAVYGGKTIYTNYYFKYGSGSTGGSNNFYVYKWSYEGTDSLGGGYGDYNKYKMTIKSTSTNPNTPKLLFCVSERGKNTCNLSNDSNMSAPKRGASYYYGDPGRTYFVNLNAYLNTYNLGFAIYKDQYICAKVKYDGQLYSLSCRSADPAKN